MYGSPNSKSGKVMISNPLGAENVKNSQNWKNDSTKIIQEMSNWQNDWDKLLKKESSSVKNLSVREFKWARQIGSLKVETEKLRTGRSRSLSPTINLSEQKKLRPEPQTKLLFEKKIFQNFCRKTQNRTRDDLNKDAPRWTFLGNKNSAKKK